MEKPLKIWIITESTIPHITMEIAFGQLRDDPRLFLMVPGIGETMAGLIQKQFKGNAEVIHGTAGLAAADPAWADVKDVYDPTSPLSEDDRAATAAFIRLASTPDENVIAISKKEDPQGLFGEKQEAVRPEEEGKTEDEQPKGFIERFVMMPPGTFAPNRVLLQGKDVPETCFLIKEHSKVIRKLPRRIHLEFRGDVSVFNGVGLVVLVLRVNNRPFLTYETWLNYHYEELDHARAMFEELSKQQELIFNWYGKSRKIEKQTHTDNMLREFFKEAIEKLSPLPAWTMEEFDRAKAECFKESMTPQQLWNTLGAVIEKREKAH